MYQIIIKLYNVVEVLIANVSNWSLKVLFYDYSCILRRKCFQCHRIGFILWLSYYRSNIWVFHGASDIYEVGLMPIGQRRSIQIPATYILPLEEIISILKWRYFCLWLLKVWTDCCCCSVIWTMLLTLIFILIERKYLRMKRKESFCVNVLSNASNERREPPFSGVSVSLNDSNNAFVRRSLNS